MRARIAGNIGEQPAAAITNGVVGNMGKTTPTAPNANRINPAIVTTIVFDRH